ncbi:hypothetical protein ACFQ14_10665 [Pseudahrensia aquimaris]|uniref:Uncharacterized protein n=1 Tax=Pseudahrensia aquimaris TaxID=744461 RepID=A0ABW3FEH9_9HYPH
MSARRNTQDSQERTDYLGPMTNIDREFLKIAEELLAVTENGVHREASMMELIVKKLFKAGLGDSAHAKGQILKYLARAEQKRERDRERRVQNGLKWKAIQQERLVQAEAAGQSTRLILPHPDDMTIDPKQGVILIGPFDEHSLMKLERDIQERNVFMLQAVLEDRIDWPTPSGSDNHSDEVFQGGSARLICMLIDQTLPERHRVSDDDWIRHEWLHRQKTKRELLKEVRRAWRSIGKSVPRGALTPSVDKTVRAFKAGQPFLTDLIFARKNSNRNAAKTAALELAQTMLDIVHPKDLSNTI